MSRFRVFTRTCWEANDAWPDGYEPVAQPMDKCPTLFLCDDVMEARDYCALKNERWRRYTEAVRAGTATKTQLRVHYTSRRYEWEVVS